MKYDAKDVVQGSLWHKCTVVVTKAVFGEQQQRARGRRWMQQACRRRCIQVQK
jgi:hypothetical protein